MRVAWIGGSAARHLYYANALNKEFGLVGGIMQWRTDGNPTPPSKLETRDRLNFERHFTTRADKEYQAFGDQKLEIDNVVSTLGDGLNSEACAEHMRELKPDVVMVFGCGMIREPLMSSLPHMTINLHLGLSPRYRGAATLFWPFYFLEPNHAGVTFHHIVHSPDAGRIIHQVRPPLYAGDGIHDVAVRAVVKATTDAVKLLMWYELRRTFRTLTQKPEAGKNFLESDFKPQHLRMIYHDYNNRIVDAYLEGRIKAKEPKLFVQEEIYCV